MNALAQANVRAAPYFRLGQSVKTGPICLERR